MKRTVLCLLFLATAASGRIGETLPELKARYGAPKPAQGVKSLLFEKDGIKILVTIWKGTCHEISYTGSLEFTKGQQAKLLEVNSGGSNWVPVDAAERKTADGKRVAAVLPETVMILTTEYQKHCETNGDDLEGF